MACRFELIFIAYSWLRKFPCRPFQSAEIHCLSASIKREAGAGKLGFAPLPQSFCLKSDHLHPSNWPFSPLIVTIFAHHCDHFRPSKWPLWDEMCSRNIESAIQDFFDTYLFGIVRAKIYENPHSIWAPYHILTDKTLGSAYARACPNFFSPLEASSSLPCPSLPQNELFMKLMLHCNNFGSIWTIFTPTCSKYARKFAPWNSHVTISVL